GSRALPACVFWLSFMNRQQRATGLADMLFSRHLVTVDSSAALNGKPLGFYGVCLQGVVGPRTIVPGAHAEESQDSFRSRWLEKHPRRNADCPPATCLAKALDQVSYCFSARRRQVCVTTGVSCGDCEIKESVTD